MTAIHILLVDDQWGASPELLGEALAGAPSATTLFEGTPLEDGSQVYRLVIHAFTGQSVLGNALVNDVTKTLEHLQHLSCQVPLSLVLLDMRFDSGPLDARGRPKGRRGDDRFGAELFRAIREAQKELPLVFLSTYGQDDVGGETVAYLSKSDLTDHALAVCLLRHGRITLEQRRSLLRLQSEVVVAPSTTAAYQAAFEIAPLPLPVMITGETGTGKEILARYIHRSSTRAEGPFVAVNVNAVPRELFEAMFFGHMRGSFTGANEDRPGYFEQADGGTLFLDEVGDLPVELQVKLLRVLETKTIKRLGARSDIHIDVRLVSATNRFDANGEVQGLREDVKFRLCGLAVHLDPLRDRRILVTFRARALCGGSTQSRVSYSRPCSLATCEVHSRAPTRIGPATSSRRMGVPCFWTRWVIYPWSCRSNSCACSKPRPSSGLALEAIFISTYASCLRPTDSMQTVKFKGFAKTSSFAFAGLPFI
jgi:hypothetical protein